MSKIANDGLTRSGTRCFIAVAHMATVGVKGLKNGVRVFYISIIVSDPVCLLFVRGLSDWQVSV